MKAGANFQKRSDPAANLCATFRGFGDAGKNFEQRALPCSVASDDADDFTPLDFERNVVERPDVGIAISRAVAVSRFSVANDGSQPAKRSGRRVG